MSEDNPLNDKVVAEIVTEEGLGAIGDLFDFFSQALAVAVDWIHQYNPEMTPVQIQQVISGHVPGKSLEEIVSKFGAIADLQENL